MTYVTLAYASRFGATARLADILATSFRDSGLDCRIQNIEADASCPSGPVVVLTPIIWDRPIPAMRDWIAEHQQALAASTVACGVVCGAAGVRETGGMVYAKHLAKRVGNPELPRFALSGEIPPRERLRWWEWWLLRVFAAVMRKPQLFEIATDEQKARRWAEQFAAEF